MYDGHKAGFCVHSLNYTEQYDIYVGAGGIFHVVESIVRTGRNMKYVPPVFYGEQAIYFYCTITKKQITHFIIFRLNIIIFSLDYHKNLPDGE